jgi:hypothetical protein
LADALSCLPPERALRDQLAERLNGLASAVRATAQPLDSPAAAEELETATLDEVLSIVEGELGQS